MNALIEKWKELIGQLEVLKTYYSRLTERERYIVITSASGGLLFVMFMIFIIFVSATSSMGNKITAAQKDLEQMRNLEKTYNETEQQVREMEQTIRMTSPDFQLATELERISRKYKITIESLSNRPGMPTPLYRESQANVTVKGVNIRTLINFFHDIETSSNLMRITTLQIKPDYKDTSLLNVTFVVSTFQAK